MNTKRNIMGTLIAGALLAMSGTASASLQLEWSWTGTIADWTASSDNGAHSIVDDGVAFLHPLNGTATLSGDGDTTFTLDTNITDFAQDTKISLTEFEDTVTHVDYYHLNADSADGLGISGKILAYWISTDGPGFNQARLGETNVGGGASDVTKQIGSLLLESVNGTADPQIGYAGFPKQQNIYVVDTIKTGPVEHLTNEFTVPEPASLSLIGIGFLAALAARCRNSKA